MLGFHVEVCTCKGTAII